jgi:hypothetical protein
VGRIDAYNETMVISEMSLFSLDSDSRRFCRLVGHTAATVQSVIIFNSKIISASVDAIIIWNFEYNDQPVTPEITQKITR